jgi:hypothetical protein
MVVKLRPCNTPLTNACSRTKWSLRSHLAADASVMCLRMRKLSLWLIVSPLLSYACGETGEEKFHAHLDVESSTEACSWITLSVPSELGDWIVVGGTIHIGTGESSEFISHLTSWSQDDLSDGDELKTHPGHSSFDMCISKDKMKVALLGVDYGRKPTKDGGFAMCRMVHSIVLNDLEAGT